MTVRSTPGQGSTFSLRLFLPEVRADWPRGGLPRLQRSGYLGPRRTHPGGGQRRGRPATAGRPAAAAGLRDRAGRLRRRRPGPAGRRCSPTPSSWTWPCPASTAGKPSAACANKGPERRAAGRGLGQRLRQGPGQRRRPARRRLPRQAGAPGRPAGLAGPAQLQLQLGDAAPPAPAVHSRRRRQRLAKMPTHPPKLLESLRALVDTGYLRGITTQARRASSRRTRRRPPRFVGRLRAMARDFQLDAMNPSDPDESAR